MKKLILALVAILGFTFSVAAQDGAKKDAKKAETSKAVKKDTKTDSKVVLKKDGTPDKRYKENKDSKVVLKKDGTPDKRYKK